MTPSHHFLPRGRTLLASCIILMIGGCDQPTPEKEEASHQQKEAVEAVEKVTDFVKREAEEREARQEDQNALKRERNTDFESHASSLSPERGRR